MQSPGGKSELSKLAGRESLGEPPRNGAGGRAWLWGMSGLHTKPGICVITRDRGGKGRAFELGEVSLCLHFGEQFGGGVQGVEWSRVEGGLGGHLDPGRQEGGVGPLLAEGAVGRESWAGELPALGTLRWGAGGQVKSGLRFLFRHLSLQASPCIAASFLLIFTFTDLMCPSVTLRSNHDIEVTYLKMISVTLILSNR